ncbi:MAG: hypothetical protein M3Y87_06185 [Myxococcota bacterium]|nr:hypothetical protein [Myxococcota bacterium]
MRALVVLALALVVLPFAPASASAQESVPIDPPRLRFGVDVGGGLAWDADARLGAAMHGSVRAGVQLDRFFALYYQGRVAGAALDHDTVRTVWLVTTTNGLGFDVTLLDLFQFGGALALDYLAGDSCDGGRLCFGPAEGFYLGVDVRVALIAFAETNELTGDRSGMIVSATWHTTPLPDQESTAGALHTVTLDLGWELF